MSDFSDAIMSGSGIDPQLLQRLMGLGTVDQRYKFLQQQADQGAQLAQGAPVDYRHGKAAPQLLSGLVNLVSAGVGGYQQGQARSGQSGLAGEAAGTRSAFAKALMDASQPAAQPGQTGAPPELLAAPDYAASQETKQKGLRDALINAGLVSGDSAIKGTIEAGPRLAMEQQNLETGKLRQAMEKQKLANEEPQGALGGLTPSTFAALTKRLEVPKNTVVPPGSSVIDRNGKPIPTPGGGIDPIKQTADGIENGTAPPDMHGLGKMRVPIQAELAKRGFNLSQANLDWQATQKHLSTLNSGGQERLNQAINFVSDTIPVIRHLYSEWQQQAGASGFKVLNRATLATMKQLPGQTGATAQALETQINDFVSELGTVYKGGGTSTDKSLGMAASNLSADWNPETFEKALQLSEKNIAIRKNSVATSGVHGASASNPYAPTPSGPQQLAPAAAAAERKTVGGKTYEKRPDGWYEVTGG